uniref:EF-hand calcium-binding domain-containing protein 5 isoform X2 n=1 Tax=Geotrypetes seraphini TaxID=260995 RepID=A0A6P8PQZ1_GEOSA|nr:EF-hand calcium-binding domain-containing protein 5 isoform X2 [Geotrypetes seraphini]
MAHHQRETEQTRKVHDNRNDTAMAESSVFTQKQDGLWKAAFFEKVQQRVLNMQQNSLEKMDIRKEKDEKANKKDPPDVVAKEWLNEDKLTVDTRVYLLEKLMPTVIPGIEKLLKEVETRKLLEKEGGQLKFNPLNFLGQYLMRNNPQFHYCSQPSPYVRGMQQVIQSLKSLTQKVKLSRLTQLKEKIKETQQLREETERIETELRNKKKEALGLQFQDWTLDVTGRIPLPIYLYSYIKELSTEMLEEFLHHLSQCADGFQKTVQRDMWRRLFTNLFKTCDRGQMGFLDRPRILTLLENFYDSNNMDEDGWRFRDPRQWPVIELAEGHRADVSSQSDDGKKATTQDVNSDLGATNSGKSSPQVQEKSEEEESPQDGAGNVIIPEVNQDGQNTSTDTETNRPERSDQSLGDEATIAEQKAGSVTELAEGHRADDSSQSDDGKKATTQDVNSDLGATNSGKSSPQVQEKSEEEESPQDGAGNVIIPEVNQDGQNTSTDTETNRPEISDQSLGDEATIAEQKAASATEVLVEHDSTHRSSIDLFKDMDETVWSGDLLTSDLAHKYNLYEQKIQDEWNIMNSKFKDLQPLITDLDSQGPSRAASAFSRSTLNLPQFLQLMETFVGEEASQSAVEKLVTYIKKNYVETEEERHQHQENVQNASLRAHRKLVVTALFQKLDNDGCGFVHLNELEAQLLKYKDGSESNAIMKGRDHLLFPPGQSGELRLSAKTFQHYIESIVKELSDEHEMGFENLVAYLTSSTEKTKTERLRGSARRKWLHQILQAAENSAGNLEPVYRAVFMALNKDAEAHGNNKRISASIGLLEKDPQQGDESEVQLRYVACTSEDAPYVLNKTLHIDMQGVSFTAINEGRPIHAPQVQYHGSVHFWNMERPEEERKGSLLVMPLQDIINRTFGTLTIDTMRDTQERTIFYTHEISFYQGVCNVFSTAYHHVRNRQNVLQLVASALAWIYNRAPTIHTVTTYMMEPGLEKTDDYVLRKMMTTDNNTGMSEIHSNPATLHRKDNLFRDYLFKCADSSEAVTTDAYGERHIVVPLREPTGRALGVIDISTGQCRELPDHEMQDLQKMLQMLQGACSGILEESSGETQRIFILEAEQIGENKRVGLLFHRFMLQDLRECVQKLDLQSFAELKSYKKPPALVHDILKAVLLLFCPQWAGTSEIESWSQCKLKVNNDLIRKISCFDPTARSVDIQPELLAKYIKGIQRGAVWKHGSIPAEYLYNWVFTCLSLMELTAQLRATQQASLITLPSDSSLFENEQTSTNGDPSSS